MKHKFLIAILALPLFVQAMEYEVQSENEMVRVSKIILETNEEIPLHRDEFPRAVFAIQGGSVKQVFEDGTTNVVEFPTGQTVYLEADPVGKKHRGVNASEGELEILVVELKGKDLRWE